MFPDVSTQTARIFIRSVRACEHFMLIKKGRKNLRQMIKKNIKLFDIIQPDH